MVTATIHLPSELHEAIQTAAARSGRSEHELILAVLRERFAVPYENPLLPDHPLHAIAGIAEDPGFGSQDIGESRDKMDNRRQGGPGAKNLRSLGVVSVPGVRGAEADDWLAANWFPDEDRGHHDSAVK